MKLMIAHKVQYFFSMQRMNNTNIILTTTYHLLLLWLLYFHNKKICFRKSPPTREIRRISSRDSTPARFLVWCIKNWYGMYLHCQWTECMLFQLSMRCIMPFPAFNIRARAKFVGTRIEHDHQNSTKLDSTFAIVLPY